MKDFQFKPHQLKAITTCVNQPQVLIDLPPGRGKTAILLGIIKILRAKGRVPTTLILTHKRGMASYRKTTLGLPMVYVETAEDLRGLKAEIDRNPDRIFILSTSLLQRFDEEWKVEVPKPKKTSRKKAAKKESEEDEVSIETGSYLGEFEGPQRKVNAVVTTTQDDTNRVGVTTDKEHTLKFISSSSAEKTENLDLPASSGSLSPDSSSISSPSWEDSSIAVLFRLCSLIAIDETHNYRNYSANTTQALMAFLTQLSPRARRIGLTATPLYKNLEDMYAVISLIVPGLLGTFQEFKATYCEVRPREVQVYRWVLGLHGRRRVLVPTVIDEIVGYKNQDQFWQLVMPYIYYDPSSDISIEWKLADYRLADWTKYTEVLKGLNLADVTKVTYETPRGSLTHTFRSGETCLIFDPNGQSLLVEAADIPAGFKAKIKEDEEPYMVSKVRAASGEADLVARLVPLLKLLSQSPEKLHTTYQILDAIPADRGALLYVSYHETADFLEETLAKRYPSRVVSSIRGGEADMDARLASLAPNEFCIITPVAFQSLDFYFDTIIGYEPLQLPGRLEQLVGRITRMNSQFTKVKAHLLVGHETIEHYFHSRLLYLIKDSPLNSQPIPELPFPGVSVFDKKTSLRVLKDTLLWGKLS